MKSSWAYLMKIREALRRLVDAIFFPDIPVCGCCGKELEDRKSGVGFCRDCGAEMEKRRLPAAATDRGFSFMPVISMAGASGGLYTAINLIPANGWLPF